MKNLSFRTMVLVFIIATGVLIVNPFTSDSTADSYDLYVVTTTVKCWDSSGSIDVLCYSYTYTAWWTDPPNHNNEHSPSNTYQLSSADENYYTNSCYTGCD